MFLTQKDIRMGVYLVLYEGTDLCLQLLEDFVLLTQSTQLNLQGEPESCMRRAGIAAQPLCRVPGYAVQSTVCTVCFTPKYSLFTCSHVHINQFNHANKKSTPVEQYCTYVQGLC